MVVDPEDGASARALRLEEAVSLGYAMVDRLAKDLGVRALAIKGPVAVVQGVSPAHSSLDVDVLVEPSGHGVLCEAMDRLGWFVEGSFTVPSVLPRHATTLTHDRWPCQVDVHHRFPGLLADPEVTFDALWARRAEISLAGVRLTCGDAVANAVIAGLNALRDDRQDVVDLVVAQVNTTFDRTARTDMARLAVQVGATLTLAPVLEAVDAPAVRAESVSPRDLEAWLVRSATGRVGSSGWILEVARSPKRRWPAILWRAVVLSEEDIVRRYPGADRGWRHLQRARLSRLGSGLRTLPRAVRVVRLAASRRRAAEAPDAGTGDDRRAGRSEGPRSPHRRGF